MITIYFVRHGQTQWNKQGMFQGSKDSPLTDEGVFQAEKLAEKFINENITFDKVYSSPLGRAFRTTEIITKDRYKIYPLDEFKEISVGKMEGVVFLEFEKLHPDEYHNFFNNPSLYNPKSIEGESFESLMNRVHLGLNKIIKENSKGARILVVTHGITLRGILSYISNKGVSIDNFSKEPVPENTSITIVTYSGGDFSIELFSDRSHLK